jgi:4-hydroxy-tetrahydrodipicolinate synthase
VLGAILTAMATPFDADLRVDEAATIALAHHLVEHGSDGLVVAGTTGEASTLNDQEDRPLPARRARDGRTPQRGGGHRRAATRPSVHLTPGLETGGRRLVWPHPSSAGGSSPRRGDRGSACR